MSIVDPFGVWPGNNLSILDVSPVHPDLTIRLTQRYGCLGQLFERLANECDKRVFQMSQIPYIQAADGECDAEVYGRSTMRVGAWKGHLVR